VTGAELCAASEKGILAVLIHKESAARLDWINRKAKVIGVIVGKLLGESKSKRARPAGGREDALACCSVVRGGLRSYSVASNRALLNFSCAGMGASRATPGGNSAG
jgi:hypothetical protein